MKDLGYGVQDLVIGFRAQGVGLQVYDSGCGV